MNALDRAYFSEALRLSPSERQELMARCFGGFGPLPDGFELAVRCSLLERCLESDREVKEILRHDQV